MFKKLFNMETIVKVVKDIIGVASIVYAMAYSHKKGSTFSIILGTLIMCISGNL